MLPSSISTPDAKVNALIQMRRLDNIFIRVQAAQMAKTAISRPVEEVMALYRVEGNLGGTVYLTRPNDPLGHSGRTIIHAVLPEGWDEARLASPRLAGEGHLQVREGHPGHVTVDGDLVKEPALIDFALQICGLDEWQQVYFIRDKPMRETFIDFSDLMWTRAGISRGDRAAAGARWDALISNLVVKQFNVSGVSAVSITPTDPVKFLAGIWRRRRHSFWPALSSLLVTTPARSSMLYLLYHAHAAGLSLPVLTRALLEVHVTKPAAYTRFSRRLRRIRTWPFCSTTSTTLGTKPIQRDCANLHGLDNSTNVWLANNEPVRLDLLTNFFETAGHNVWDLWEEHRGNLSRYMVLLDYYQRLFT